MTNDQLRFGLIVQTELLGTDRDTRQRVAELREQVQVARDVGFDGIGLGHHHSIGRTQRFHPLLLGAALADEAEGLDLATLVYLSGQYHPLEVAEQVSTLDALWDGRLKLGLAPGWVEREFSALGIPYERRLARFLESLEVMKKLWTGDRVKHSGEFFELHDIQLCHLPVQHPSPEIWLGATAPAAARRVATLGHPYLLSGHPTISALGESLEAYEERVRELGVEPPSDRPILRNCFVADTEEEALEIAIPHLRESYRGFAEWKLFEDVLNERDTSGTITGPLSDQLTHFRGDRVLLGTPEGVRQQIEEVVQRLGVNYVFLRLQWPGLDNESVLGAIERVGRDVLPQVRAQVMPRVVERIGEE